MAGSLELIFKDLWLQFLLFLEGKWKYVCMYTENALPWMQYFYASVTNFTWHFISYFYSMHALCTAVNLSGILDATVAVMTVG